MLARTPAGYTFSTADRCMHPLLFSLPAPPGPLPLSSGLLALSLLLFVGAGWALAHGARRVALEALLWTLLAALAAWMLRGRGLRLGPLEVNSYGACLALGLGAGGWLTCHLAVRSALPIAQAGGALFASALGALLGARALYVVASPERESLRVAFTLSEGGLFGYGALFGAALGAALTLPRGRRELLPWFDAAVPGALLAAGFTRLGCYLDGCDFGTRLSSSAAAWFSRFGEFPGGPHSRSTAFLRQVEAGSVASAANWSLPLHPVELYEAFGCAVLLVFALWARPLQRASGQLFWRAVIAYGCLRFVLELWRGDVDRGVWGHVSLTQICALLSAALASFMLLRSTQAHSD